MIINAFFFQLGCIKSIFVKKKLQIRPVSSRPGQCTPGGGDGIKMQVAGPQCSGWNISPSSRPVSSRPGQYTPGRGDRKKMRD